MIKLLLVVGARPNFMKIAPLIHELKLQDIISYKLVHTGQHYDYKMSSAFFSDLDIPKPRNPNAINSFNQAKTADFQKLGTQETAKLFGALKTPHFFLMNSERKLLYTGRATDNPLDIEKRKTNDLEKTLEEALAGKEISNPVTNPIGCNIKWDGKPAHWMPAEACDLI